MATVHINISKDPAFSSDDIQAFREIVRRSDDLLFDDSRGIETRCRYHGALYGFTIISEQEDIKDLLKDLISLYPKSKYLKFVLETLQKKGFGKSRYGTRFHDDYAERALKTYDNVDHNPDFDISFSLMC